jgi:hypothetical protein
MSRVEYRCDATYKYYMRKTKDEIRHAIDAVRRYKGYGPADGMKLLHWTKDALAREAVKTNLLPNLNGEPTKCPHTH